MDRFHHPKTGITEEFQGPSLANCFIARLTVEFMVHISIFTHIAQEQNSVTTSEFLKPKAKQMKLC